MSKRLIVISAIFVFCLSFVAQIQASTHYFPLSHLISAWDFNEEPYTSWMTRKGEDCDWGDYDYDTATTNFWATISETSGDDWSEIWTEGGWFPRDFWYSHYPKSLQYGGYYLAGQNALPYISVQDIDNVQDKIVLKTETKHGTPVYTSGTGEGKARCPSAVMWTDLYFNVWINDTTSGSATGLDWLFNYTEGDGAHDAFVVHLVSGAFEYWNSTWSYVPANATYYNYFTDSTTHDNDLHRIVCNYTMASVNTWYEEEYDVGVLLDAYGSSDLEGHYEDHDRTIDVLGFQLMGLRSRLESICANMTGDWCATNLIDQRNISRTCDNAFTAHTRFMVQYSYIGGYYYLPMYAIEPNSVYNLTSIKVEKLGGNASCDGDANFDGTVDIFDTVIISTKWGLNEGESGWDYRAELSPDGTIDIYDLTLVSTHYGEGCTWSDASNTALWFRMDYPQNMFGLYSEIHLHFEGSDLIDLPLSSNAENWDDTDLHFGKSEGEGYVQACQLKFLTNKNTSGVVDGTRLWSAIFECDYRYS